MEPMTQTQSAPPLPPPPPPAASSLLVNSSIPSYNMDISSDVTSPDVSTNSVAQSAPTMVVQVRRGAALRTVRDSSIRPYFDVSAIDTASPSAPVPRNCASITLPGLPSSAPDASMSMSTSMSSPPPSSFLVVVVVVVLLVLIRQDSATPTSCPLPPTPVSHLDARWTLPGSRLAPGDRTKRFCSAAFRPTTTIDWERAWTTIDEDEENEEVVVEGEGSILVEDRKNADRRRASIDMFIVVVDFWPRPSKLNSWEK